MTRASLRTQSAWFLARAVKAYVSGRADIAESLAARAAECLATAFDLEFEQQREAQDSLKSQTSRVPSGAPVFNSDTSGILAKAYGVACNELPGDLPPTVYEVVLRRIAHAADLGERNVSRLTEVGLAGVVFD